MSYFPIPDSLEGFWHNCFDLKQHIRDFLDIDETKLNQQLDQGKAELQSRGLRDFDWEKATEFYRDQVEEMYLFELGAWHLGSADYIGDTLRLVADHAQGKVLDFGGGIGTHTIAAALCPQVEQVVYCDLNPINLKFTQYRAQQLGWGSDKITFCTEVDPAEHFDIILAFDVLEHLPEPSQQILRFHDSLQAEGKLIANWFFFKGLEQEYPFHLDDPDKIANFFVMLQKHFLEVFHPYPITTRCYRKWVA